MPRPREERDPAQPEHAHPEPDHSRLRRGEDEPPAQQRDERLTHRDTLRSQINEIQKTISARREAQLKHRRYLDGQSRYNEPELDFWESYLGLRIEGLGKDDRLKFVYTNVDEREWDREAWFELDTSERDYKVLEIRPKAEREEVDRVVERLNETRDLAGFLKGMRELFVEACK